jgi:hypothetical protein
MGIDPASAAPESSLRRRFNFIGDLPGMPAGANKRGAFRSPTKFGVRAMVREKARCPVHETLGGLLKEFAPQYETAGISEELHTRNIALIGQAITARHPDLLRNGKFRVGSAQKALNLHLKYRWCLGEIPIPPHCLFDGYVLRAIPGWRTCSWTAMDSITQYTDLVAAARTVADGRPLAEWELTVYNAMMNSQ